MAEPLNRTAMVTTAEGGAQRRPRNVVVSAIGAGVWVRSMRRSQFWVDPNCTTGPWCREGRGLVFRPYDLVITL